MEFQVFTGKTVDDAINEATTNMKDNKEELDY